MRLHNTLTRSLEELPPPPGPVRMYVCGPTVYARAHVGNARPFVIGMWLRRWLRETGYDVTLVHNITDVNDRIYEAAPGRSAELADQATAWYLEDTGDLGLGHARPPAEGDRAHQRHRRPRRRRSSTPVTPTPSRATSTSALRAGPSTAASRGSGRTRSRSRSRTR